MHLISASHHYGSRKLSKCLRIESALLAWCLLGLEKRSISQGLMRSSTTAKLQTLIAQHKLPSSYADQIERCVMPITQSVSQHVAQVNRPLLLGLQGSQGSGKSTLGRFLCLLLREEFKLNTKVCSIDDFYLSREQRQTLAKRTHPLLQTRGVPGTHDTQGMYEAFAKFKFGKQFVLPLFDKGSDDIKPKDQWTQVDDRPDVLIFEGWCVGVPPQADEQLVHPINTLESEEDLKQVWRTFVNNALEKEYQQLFHQLDSLIVLNAPSFECVFGWRAKQEEQLIEQLRKSGKSTEYTMSEQQLVRFIHHYQRLTEHALLVLPDLADYMISLNESHEMIELNLKPSEGI